MFAMVFAQMKLMVLLQRQFQDISFSCDMLIIIYQHFVNWIRIKLLLNGVEKPRDVFYRSCDILHSNIRKLKNVRMCLICFCDKPGLKSTKLGSHAHEFDVNLTSNISKLISTVKSGMIFNTKCFPFFCDGLYLYLDFGLIQKQTNLKTYILYITDVRFKLVLYILPRLSYVQWKSIVYFSCYLGNFINEAYARTSTDPRKFRIFKIDVLVRYFACTSSVQK